MAQEKPVHAQVSEQKTETKNHVVPARGQSVIKSLEDEEFEYDFWQDLRDSLPPWIDEIVGFALFVFGILSFISLYFPSQTQVALAWADILHRLFGDGSVFVAGALFAFGILIWLPKAGLRLRFSSLRLLSLEIIFLAVLALLHLRHGGVELRALARAGQGGGLLGWGISYPVNWVMGKQPAMAFFAFVIAASIIVLLGLRRRHIVAFLGKLSQRLSDYSQGPKPANQPEPDQNGIGLYRRLATAPGYRTGFMRIRTDPANLPAELRESPPATADTSRTKAQAGPAPTTAENEHSKTEDEPDDAPGSSVKVSGQTDPAAAGKTDARGQAAAPATEKTAHKARQTVEQKQTGNGAGNIDGLPELALLSASELALPDQAEIDKNIAIIENTLLENGIAVEIAHVQTGPAVTRYALQPHKADGGERIRLSKISAYARELSLALAGKRLRIETPVAGTNYAGIEVPNEAPCTVALRDVMASEGFRKARANSASSLIIPLGRDIANEAVAIDLAATPNLLIAGMAGSGRSVCMAAIATSLLLQHNPERLQMIMLDAQKVDLTRFAGIPHLLGPVESNSDRIIGVLRWCLREMDRRYKLLEKHSARNIELFNERQAEDGNETGKMPYLAIFIGDLGALMQRDSVETEACVSRLAQMARAVGMHLVIATRRASADIVTGFIKANFPARIAFAVASSADSRVIVDKAGAEQLLGAGDMLFHSGDAAGHRRVQACYVSAEDIGAVVQHWKGWQRLQRWQAERPDWRSGTSSNAAPWQYTLDRRQFLAETDPLLEEVVKLIVVEQEASAALIQRRLAIAKPRAAQIMELLGELDALGEELAGGSSRRVTIPPVPDPIRFIVERHLRKQQDN